MTAILKRSVVWAGLFVLLTAGHWVAAIQPQPARLFVFHADEFWLNLHHFLYVLGRAVNKTPESTREAVAGAPADQERGLATLTDEERTIWREAVAAYAGGLSKKDAVFDDPLPGIATALARAGDAASLTAAAIDAEIATILERAAPVYRKAWWIAHRTANRGWQTEAQTLVDRHGAAVLAFIERAYALQWPAEGFPVHLSGYSNWAGAYSTRGNLLVVASVPGGNRGLYALETVFHEGMHQWDDAVLQALREHARRLEKLVPSNLSHAMIFFTAGEAIRQIDPKHVPAAERFGIWQRGLGPFKAPLEQAWKPYLDGRGTREEALADLLERTGTERRSGGTP